MEFYHKAPAVISVADIFEKFKKLDFPVESPEKMH